MKHGWIRLHRKMLECHELKGNPIATSLWVNLLLSSEIKPTDCVWRGRTIQLSAGQLIISERKMAEAIGCDRQRLRTALRLLKTAGMIAINPISNPICSVVTICKFTAFQALLDTANPISNPQRAPNPISNPQPNPISNPQTNPMPALASHWEETENSRLSTGANPISNPISNPQPNPISNPKLTQFAPQPIESTPEFEPLKNLKNLKNLKESESKKDSSSSAMMDSLPWTPAMIEIEFRQFWLDYPRKVGMGQAHKAFLRAVKHAGNPEIIQSGLERAKRRWRNNGTENQFIPHPTTWLNGQRWTDEDGPANARFNGGKKLEGFAFVAAHIAGRA